MHFGPLNPMGQKRKSKFKNPRWQKAIILNSRKCTMKSIEIGDKTANINIKKQQFIHSVNGV